MIADAYRIYREHVANNLDEGEIDNLFIGRFDDTEYHQALLYGVMRYYEIEGCVIEEDGYHYVFENL